MLHATQFPTLRGNNSLLESVQSWLSICVLGVQRVHDFSPSRFFGAYRFTLHLSPCKSHLLEFPSFLCRDCILSLHVAWLFALSLQFFSHIPYLHQQGWSRRSCSDPITFIRSPLVRVFLERIHISSNFCCHSVVKHAPLQHCSGRIIWCSLPVMSIYRYPRSNQWEFTAAIEFLGAQSTGKILACQHFAGTINEWMTNFVPSVGVESGGKDCECNLRQQVVDIHEHHTHTQKMFLWGKSFFCKWHVFYTLRLYAVVNEKTSRILHNISL